MRKIHHSYTSRTFVGGRIRESWQLALVASLSDAFGLAVVRSRGEVGLLDGRFELAAYVPFAAPVGLGQYLGDVDITERNKKDWSNKLVKLRQGIGLANSWFEATVDEFSQWIRRRGVSPELTELFNEQSDHVRLLFEVGDISDEYLRDWEFSEGQTSFLQGFPPDPGGPVELSLTQAMLEDNLITQELESFSDWVRGGSNGTFRRFRNRRGDKEMRIYNVNRGGIERASGSDLIYFNVNLNAMVLIQVKRMTDRGGFDKQLGFRPGSDKNLKDELDRLRKIDDACWNLESEVRAASDFRLYPHPSFIKLSDSRQLVVERDILSPVTGMIFPLKHFELLLESDDIKGPRGGRVFTRKQNLRWLNSTDITSLIKRGLVGSRGTGTYLLQRIIDNITRGLHSPIIAVHESVKDVRNEPPTLF